MPALAQTRICEVGLLSYLRRRYSHVSAERVCSGRWMINLYELSAR